MEITSRAVNLQTFLLGQRRVTRLKTIQIEFVPQRVFIRLTLSVKSRCVSICVDIERL